MTRLLTVMMILVCLFAASTVQVRAIDYTCDQCREFDKKRAHSQMELARSERQLEKAFKKKQFRSVTQIRAKITEIRRTLLTLKSREPDCKIACRPDVVKNAYCRKIITELVRLDKDQLVDKEDREKIDERYRDLADCNRDLKKLRKLHNK